MKPSLRTPLAMSILSTLRERPMHPYEIFHTMEFRKHDRVVKLRRSSLYSTIDRLEAEGLIVAIGTDREGRRPERTTYDLTPEGEGELLDWLRESIASPAQEFSRFGSLIAFLPHLMPWEAVSLLRQRLAHLERESNAHESMLAEPQWRHMPSLFKVHEGYAATMREAEIAWVRRLAEDIEAGRLPWPGVIVDWHRRRGSWRDAADSKPPSEAIDA
jgi:DNA-binding PadR family transcriptional regulator